jgi:hypothetical protein
MNNVQTMIFGTALGGLLGGLAVKFAIDMADPFGDQFAEYIPLDEIQRNGEWELENFDEVVNSRMQGQDIDQYGPDPDKWKSEDDEALEALQMDRQYNTVFRAVSSEDLSAQVAEAKRAADDFLQAVSTAPTIPPNVARSITKPVFLEYRNRLTPIPIRYFDDDDAFYNKNGTKVQDPMRLFGVDILSSFVDGWAYSLNPELDKLYQIQWVTGTYAERNKRRPVQ